ncbi:MAG: glycerol-3-phosphate 1-O-acyltransferase PlsY [Verrucomicrobiota bacterium]|nr:glycerol-3-phosphate 1-O-acyltransferase PlsY [Verrucomicrobiota bacterium]
MTFLTFILIALGAYIIGSFPTGFLIAKALKIDIRSVGSGNIGATNCFRILGKKWGATVLIVDILKGVLPIVILNMTGIEDPKAYLRVLAAICVVLGHNYTCWLNFKGGKGVATSAGALLALMPLAFGIVIAVFGVIFAVTRYVSAGSLGAALALPFIVWFFYGAKPEYYTLLGLVVLLSGLVILRHRANIKRLLNGTENRVGGKK